MSDKLILEGVNAKGYGNIPKLVMKDDKLSIEAKAIYAYFCSYAGGGTHEAFPAISLICHDLGISENRLFKHRKLLVERGYISIRREKKDKGWSKNIYTIHQTVHLQNVGIQNEGVGNEGIQNEGTNKNSSNNNSINKNSKNKEPSSKKIYGEFKNVYLTDKHISLLKHHYPNDYKDRIERLSSYMESKGKTDYKNHYAVIRNWAKNEEPKQTSHKAEELLNELD